MPAPGRSGQQVASPPPGEQPPDGQAPPPPGRPPAPAPGRPTAKPADATAFVSTPASGTTDDEASVADAEKPDSGEPVSGAPVSGEHSDATAADASSWVEEVDEKNRTHAIDATLARFSAVHDQIAEEEEARRKRYGWLLGKRKEPEPGQDMPFDFKDGRDGEFSRVEWKKQRRQRRATRLLKAVAIAAAVTIFVATGIGWSAKAWVDAKFREVAALDPNSAAIEDAHLQEGDLNFLLVGSDTRAHASRASGVGSVKSTPGARSDTAMVAHIPADRSRVVIVSFPRDLEVDVPACEKWNSRTGKYTGTMLPPRNDVKFNVAYATGGPKCTTKVVQRISGLSITNFLGINFQGFRAMVNAVNGVKICTTTPIVDSVLGTVLPHAGTYKLNGKQALQYVRARHVEGDPTADYGRMQRQQLFLSALLRKVMSAKVLLDPSKLSDFVNAVAANTFGENISTDQLVELGQSLQDLDTNKVTFITVPTTGVANESGNEELRESATNALFRAIIEGMPIAPPKQEQQQAERASQEAPAAQAAGSAMTTAAVARPAVTSPAQTSPAQTSPAQTSPAQTSSVSPEQVRVEVLNTTGESGLAGRTASELRGLGYTVDGVGNLDSDAEGTVIRYAPGDEAAAKLLATSIPGAELVADPSTGRVIQLELGSGFDGTVRAPDTGEPEVPQNLKTVNAARDTCGGVA